MSKSKTLWIGAILLVAFGGHALAQSGPIGQNFLVTPKSGQAMQWEAAYQEHLKWHEGINDSWSWITWQFMSGPNTGKYLVRSGGHEWKDFDERGDLEQEDATNFFENAGKLTESYRIQFDRTHSNLSRTGDGPYKVIELTHLSVKPSMVPKFMGVIGKFHAAFEKTNSPAHYVIAQTETGGATSDFTFVSLHKTYATLETPPDAMPKMMEEVYGGLQAAGIFEEFWSCVDTMESEMMVLREDLTYRPSSSSSQ